MDHPIFISTVLFLMVLLGISFFGYRQFYKPSRVYKHTLGAPVISGGGKTVVVATAEDSQSGALVTILRHIGARVPISPINASQMRRSLMMAGHRSEGALGVFFGLRVVGAAVMGVVGLALRRGFADMPMFGLVMVVASAMAGWVLPGFLLEKRIAARQRVLRLSLPDALDLMVISIEAGLGLDQAIQHVSRELQTTHPVLSEELSLVTLEMRAGKRRSEALRNLSDRTGESELRKLVAILIQNDRFGTSMGDSLRNHSDFLRVRRRQDAEERAGKVGVKLVFPIFFCILPSMLVVAAGPGLLQIFKYLFPMMKQAQQ
jgi:tight adherence protein C